METRLNQTHSNDDLLVSWKDIASYLKCSIRKAQRLEQQGLPVHRISGAKSVWALKPAIDRWLTSMSEGTTAQPGVSRESALEYTDTETIMPPAVATPMNSLRSRVSAFPLVLLCVAGILAALAAVAVIMSAYAAAIALFAVTVTCLWIIYPTLPDTALTRAAVGLLIVAGMSYAASATTLPTVVESTINMASLLPAIAYPFAAGLRFIPIPILICIYLVAVRLPVGMNLTCHRRLRRAYWIFGVLSLLAAIFLTVGESGAIRIWNAGLPIRSTLLIGNLFVWGVNSVLLVLGYRFFNAAEVGSYREFLLRCGVGYLVIALTAAIISSHWHDIDRHFLDVRQAQAYRSANANAIPELQNWLQAHRNDGGSDLIRLARNAEFRTALRNQNFYKSDFDEPYQVSHRAVIFGYRNPVNAIDGKPSFVLIRFPMELSAALQFEPVEPETVGNAVASDARILASDRVTSRQALDDQPNHP